MALYKTLSRIGAAAALSFAILTPLAMADERGRGDRGGWHDRDDRGDRGHRGDRHHGDRGDHRGDRGDRYRGDRHRGDHDRGRDLARHMSRQAWHGASRHAYRAPPPRVVNRYYYNSPRYYRPGPRVNFHYNRGYYHNGYRIGGYYSYRPTTIIIRDYGQYGLYAPPHGHHWVRDPYSNDAVLTSVATGAIIGLAVGILSQ